MVHLDPITGKKDTKKTGRVDAQVVTRHGSRMQYTLKTGMGV